MEELKPVNWKTESFTKNKDNISIGYIEPDYIEVNEEQDINTEYKKIKAFLNRYVERYSKNNKVPIEDLTIEFINYGKTELVYVLSEKTGKRTTLLVKQPAVQLGKIKQEAQNLITLEKRSKNIVAPIDYFQLEDQELFVTPYINQARCIASYRDWGMYIPEPYYRYDFTNKEGISSCKLGGGDFMLPKGWEEYEPTIENTLNELYLIAAREKVKCSFDEYISIIRDEFSRATIDENQENLIINLRGRVPMQIEDIESGIELGKTIIYDKNTKFITNEENIIEEDNFER